MPNELDIQLDVSECIPDATGNCQLDPALMPRRPNAVSHRGHELKVNVRLLSLPPDTTHITLRAYVIAYGPDRLGTQEFIFRAGRLFGTNPGETFPAPSKFPHDLSIRVSDLGSDHLGQGPYEVIVNVETVGGESLTAPAAGGADATQPATSGTTADDPPDGIQIIEERTFFLNFISL